MVLDPKMSHVHMFTWGYHAKMPSLAIHPPRILGRLHRDSLAHFSESPLVAPRAPTESHPRVSHGGWAPPRSFSGTVSQFSMGSTGSMRQEPRLSTRLQGFNRRRMQGDETARGREGEGNFCFAFSERSPKAAKVSSQEGYITFWREARFI